MQENKNTSFQPHKEMSTIILLGLKKKKPLLPVNPALPTLIIFIGKTK